MARKQSGGPEPLPFELKWSTFCREILQAPGKENDASLIGLLNALNLSFETPEPMDSVDIPMVIWLHSHFRFAKISEFERKYAVSILITVPNREPVKKEIDFVQKPNQEFLAFNFQLVMNGKDTMPRFNRGRNLIKVSYRYKTTDLGKAELPVIVVIQTADEG
jgi:hypothetical protein